MQPEFPEDCNEASDLLMITSILLDRYIIVASVADLVINNYYNEVYCK